jgi:hypothetical protein
VSYAHPVERAALIEGFRDLADYLESNPDVPTTIDATVYAFPPKWDCAVMRAEIDAIAEMIGSQAREVAEGRHYIVTRSFGPVEYRAVAICKDACHADGEEREG